jgi:hypothetical protein
VMAAGPPAWMIPPGCVADAQEDSASSTMTLIMPGNRFTGGLLSVMSEARID